MKAFACLAILGLTIAGCSFRSDTVVQKPQPATASSTTYVTPDASSPTGTSATTVYHN